MDLDNNWIIGHKLCNLRLKKGYTLTEAADAVGCSAQFLSMAENGRSGISLNKLQKLLGFYGSTLAELTVEPNEAGRVTRLEWADRLNTGDEMPGVEALLVSHNTNPEDPSLTYFRMEPGAVIDSVAHSGAEILFMLDGVIHVTLRNSGTGVTEEYELCKGDSIHHESTLQHVCRNDSNKIATFLVIQWERELSV